VADFAKIFSLTIWVDELTKELRDCRHRVGDTDSHILSLEAGQKAIDKEEDFDKILRVHSKAPTNECTPVHNEAESSVKQGHQII
jgi:hypothetical protein